MNTCYKLYLDFVYRRLIYTLNQVDYRSILRRALFVCELDNSPPRVSDGREQQQTGGDDDRPHRTTDITVFTRPPRPHSKTSKKFVTPRFPSVKFWNMNSFFRCVWFSKEYRIRGVSRAWIPVRERSRARLTLAGAHPAASAAQNDFRAILAKILAD